MNIKKRNDVNRKGRVEYVSVYVHANEIIQKLTGRQVCLLMCLVSWCQTGMLDGTMFVRANARNRILKKLNISNSTFTRDMAKLVEEEAMQRESKGVYHVNPFVMWKGNAHSWNIAKKEWTGLR